MFFFYLLLLLGLYNKKNGHFNSIVSYALAASSHD